MPVASDPESADETSSDLNDAAPRAELCAMTEKHVDLNWHLSEFGCTLEPLRKHNLINASTRKRAGTVKIS